MSWISDYEGNRGHLRGVLLNVPAPFSVEFYKEVNHGGVIRNLWVLEFTDEFNHDGSDRGLSKIIEHIIDMCKANSCGRIVVKKDLRFGIDFGKEK